MNRWQTSEGQSRLEATEALLPTLKSCGDQIEAERQLPQPLVDALTAAGLFKMLVPKRFGGSEIDPISYCRIVESLARVDASTGWVVSLSAIVGTAAACFSEEVAWEIFGAPNACVVGSAAPAPHATLNAPVRPPDRAVVTEGGYCVTSRWAFTSGCKHATWLMGVGTIYEGDEVRKEINGNPENRYFFFPTADCQIIDTWNVVGLRGSGSHDYAVVDKFVAQKYTLPRNNELKQIHPGSLYTFAIGTPPDAKKGGPWTGLASIGTGAVCLGIARGALDDLIDLAAVKTARGTTGLLANNPIFQDQLGRAEATLGAARAYLYETVGEIWEGVLTTGLCLPKHHQLLNLASVHAATLSTEVVEVVWKAAGASAVFTSNPFERRLRDIHSVTQNISVRPDLYTDAGRMVLGLE